MSIRVTLEMTVRDGQYEALVPFLEQNLPRVRGFDGALSVTLFYDPETRGFLIFEEWLSREHHGAYIAAITENGVMDQLLGFMDGPPEVRYYKRMVL